MTENAEGSSSYELGWREYWTVYEPQFPDTPEYMIGWTEAERLDGAAERSELAITHRRPSWGGSPPRREDASRD